MANMYVAGPAQGDGLILGTSSGLISFFGADPVAQQSAISSVATTAAVTTTPHGYTTGTQADGIVTALNSVISALETLGLIAT